MAADGKSGTKWYSNPKVLGRIQLVAGVALIGATYGYVAHAKEWFPYGLVQTIKAGKDEVEKRLGWKLDWYYREVGDVPVATTLQPGKMQPGLTITAGLGPKDHTQVTVVDAQGKEIQRYDLDWWKLWPDAKHVPEGRFNGPPGPIVHGMMFAPNGDVLVNMENAGLLRVNACGAVVWKLPRLVHHAIFADEQGNYWVNDNVLRNEKDPTLPGFKPPFEDSRILKVSPDGKILKEWRIVDLLRKNGIRDWLYLGDVNNIELDPLHLNDVDIFPSSMAPGTFQPGDMMISLRNISTIVVLDPETGIFKHVFRGPFVRQHDPDFIDGNTIRLFDNNTPSQNGPLPSSRIVEIHADDRPPKVLFEGTEKQPFFSHVMGKQQTLANGNILITEAVPGRAIEIDPQGKPVWEFRTFYRKGVSAMMSEATRLDPRYDAAFFQKARAACGG